MIDSEQFVTVSLSVCSRYSLFSYFPREIVFAFAANSTLNGERSVVHTQFVFGALALPVARERNNSRLKLNDR